LQCRLQSKPWPAGSFGNDAAGNLTQWTGAHSVTTNYAYDAANRMAVADTPSGVFTYTYSGSGARLQKHTPSGTRNFLYDHKRLLMETDASTHDPLVTYNNMDDEYGGLLDEFNEESTPTTWFHQCVL
jgi:YD repeat-containing protein